jgi:hypothetical protein
MIEGIKDGKGSHLNMNMEIRYSALITYLSTSEQNHHLQRRQE